MRLSPLVCSLVLAALAPACSPGVETVRYEDVGYQKGVYTYGGNPFTGVATTAYPDGSRHQEFSFARGLHHGVTREWNEAGTLIVETHFDSGKRHGPNTYWHPDGSLAKEQHYEHGKSISEKTYPAESP